MKIQIWIKKEDAISGKITEYHCHIPQVSYNNYVQVVISQNEFARLEDSCRPVKETKSDIFDEFPEYKELTLGEFQGWYSGLDDASKKRYKELQNSTQDNKRNK